jgi:hypothetical protein
VQGDVLPAGIWHAAVVHLDEVVGTGVAPFLLAAACGGPKELAVSMRAPFAARRPQRFVLESRGAVRTGRVGLSAGGSRRAVSRCCAPAAA